MFQFGYAPFAIGGLIAAAAPLVIHLLNRRRYRIVDWAAMDLLREAIARNRRILHLRDWLLLLLRTACVILFGLALAQPHWKSGSAAVDPNQPMHAIVVVDNSLSMGAQRLDGKLLDEAKARINEFFDRLPAGSRISVIPACGSAQPWSNDAYRTTADAREALSRIEIVDRSAVLAAAVDLAAQACKLAPEVPTKRVIFVGDQQRLNWPAGGADDIVKSLPDVQIVQVAGEASRANAWIADFRLQDDLADSESPAVFTGVVRYEGPAPRHDVEVVLTVDGVRVAAQTIDLEPGQSRQVRFSQQLSVAVEPGEPTFVAATLSLAPDQLPEDDVRHLMAPVVAALPVLFIDELGAEAEAPKRNRYGESFHLRRLLSPARSRDDAVRQL
ncbi:MAG: BatA domain-containing protein, partial [Planctomycetes bacterium]|nr:BatA domain-containing protein [Planctomycetota bacterium]